MRIFTQTLAFTKKKDKFNHLSKVNLILSNLY